MHRKFIAIILGAALAVTGLSTTPVRAQDRGETAAIIAGIAALAIIGAAVSNDRKKDRRKDYVTRGHGHNYKHHNRRYEKKRYHKKKRHYREERRHHQRHIHNHRHRAQPTFNNRGHRAHQYSDRGQNRYAPHARYRRHQDRR